MSSIFFERSSQNSKRHLIVFLTLGSSLENWILNGTLAREIALYLKLAGDYNWSISFVSYGKPRSDISQQLCPDLNEIRLSSLRSYYNLYKHIKEKEVVLKSNQIWGAWIPGLFSLFCRKPFLARCGYEPLLFSFYRKDHFVKKIFLWVIGFFVYLISGKIHVATRIDQAFIDKSYFKLFSKKIRIAPNYIVARTPRRCNPRRCCSAHLGLIWIGRLVNQKDPMHLESILKHEKVTVTVIGEGPLAPEFSRLARDFSDRLNWVERVPHEHLGAMFDTHDFLLSTALYEGHPKAILEALASGLPVLYRDAPGVTELFGNGARGCRLVEGVIDELLNEPIAVYTSREEDAMDFAMQFRLETLAEVEDESLRELFGWY